VIETTHLIRVESLAELERFLKAKIRPTPALFLSASVPYLRETRKDLPNAERERERQRNQHYLQTAEPARIRSAVVALTQAALLRGMRLVFGAHPAISPMVLSVARDARATARSILVFQSAFFEDQLPNATLELADWTAGALIMTAKRSAAPPLNARQQSLSLMRKLMVSVPGLRGAVFIGGMEGVEEEANIFRQTNPRLPLYAVASTGSAAADLFEHATREVAGTLKDPTLLKTCRSYSLLARRILDDLKSHSRGSRNRGSEKVR
jgi:hypothetical protein